jgi:hypothetical protein
LLSEFFLRKTFLFFSGEDCVDEEAPIEGVEADFCSLDIPIEKAACCLVGGASRDFDEEGEDNRSTGVISFGRLVLGRRSLRVPSGVEMLCSLVIARSELLLAYLNGGEGEAVLEAALGPCGPRGIDDDERSVFDDGFNRNLGADRGSPNCPPPRTFFI